MASEQHVKARVRETGKKKTNYVWTALSIDRQIICLCCCYALLSCNRRAIRHSQRRISTLASPPPACLKNVQTQFSSESLFLRWCQTSNSPLAPWCALINTKKKINESTRSDGMLFFLTCTRIIFFEVSH